MATIQDEEFDTFFKRYGTIIQNCKPSIKDGIMTGNRSIKIDLHKEIERKVDIIFATGEEGDYVIDASQVGTDMDEIRARGSIMVYYSDQIYECNRCSRSMMKRVSHNSMCPLRKADLEAKDKAAK